MINTNSYSKQTSASDLEPAITNDLNNADEARATSLDGLQAVRTAKAGALAREQARLTAAYGADDPRTVQAANRVAANQTLIQGVAIETEHARTNVPTVDETTYALHGYVRDASLAGLPDLTVALFDDSGAWIRQYGYACTDATGHFSITIQADALTGKYNQSTGAYSSSVLIHVIDKNNVTLFIDTKSLTVQAGTVDYRVIILGQTASACAPPDAANQPGPPVSTEVSLPEKQVRTTGDSKQKNLSMRSRGK